MGGEKQHQPQDHDQQTHDILPLTSAPPLAYHRLAAGRN